MDFPPRSTESPPPNVETPPPTVETPPPAFRTLMTSEELRGLHGKLGSLKKLMYYPKSYDPQVFEVLVQIEKSHNNLIGWAVVPYTQPRRDRIDEEVRIVRILENMVVQHVIKGKPWDQLRDEANTAYRSRFRNPTTWMFFPSLR